MHTCLVALVGEGNGSPARALQLSSIPCAADPVVFYDNFDYDGPYVQLLTGSWDLSGMPLSSVRVRPGCAVALYKEDGQSYILYEDERAFGPDYNDQVSTAVVTCATNVTIKNACPDAQTYKINYYCSGTSAIERLWPFFGAAVSLSHVYSLTRPICSRPTRMCNATYHHCSGIGKSVGH
jgi:hypothetical protein